MISPSAEMYGFHFGLCGATFARIKDISGIYVVEMCSKFNSISSPEVNGNNAA
jgi:hypothetical protein